MVSGYDHQARKARLTAKLEGQRKDRERRFTRLAVPAVILSFGVFLFGTDAGREMLNDFKWLTTSDASITRWVFAYFVFGTILTMSIDWGINKVIKRDHNND